MKHLLILFAMCLAWNVNAQIIRGHQNFEFTVTTLDRETLEPIDNVQLGLYKRDSGEFVSSAYTDENGVAVFFIDPKTDYVVESCKKLFITHPAEIYSCHTDGKVFCAQGFGGLAYADGGGHDKPHAMLNSELLIDSIVVGKTFSLDDVYYDYDRWALRKSSRKELNKLVDIMNAHPSLTIELASHTDSRGSVDYNQNLSQQRAESCYNYLIENGISSDRIFPVGYGESTLLNECADGISCGESAHQINRRTEFTLLSFEGTDCNDSGFSSNTLAIAK